MKRKLDGRLKLSRVRRPGFTWMGDSKNGAFLVKIPGGRRLYAIASVGDGWEHISVSVLPEDKKHEAETPLWEEMTYIADLFFEPEETVLQIRPPKSEYVNFAVGCLHWWRPMDEETPRPPKSHV